MAHSPGPGVYTNPPVGGPVDRCKIRLPRRPGTGSSRAERPVRPSDRPSDPVRTGPIRVGRALSRAPLCRVLCPPDAGRWIGVKFGVPGGPGRGRSGQSSVERCPGWGSSKSSRAELCGALPGLGSSRAELCGALPGLGSSRAELCGALPGLGPGRPGSGQFEPDRAPAGPGPGSGRH